MFIENAMVPFTPAVAVVLDILVMPPPIGAGVLDGDDMPGIPHIVLVLKVFLFAVSFLVQRRTFGSGVFRPTEIDHKQREKSIRQIRGKEAVPIVPKCWYALTS